MPGDIRGLVSDPEFQGLSDEEKRAILARAGAPEGFADEYLKATSTPASTPAATPPPAAPPSSPLKEFAQGAGEQLRAGALGTAKLVKGAGDWMTDLVSPAIDAVVKRGPVDPALAARNEELNRHLDEVLASVAPKPNEPVAKRAGRLTEQVAEMATVGGAQGMGRLALPAAVAGVAGGEGGAALGRATGIPGAETVGGIGGAIIGGSAISGAANSMERASAAAKARPSGTQVTAPPTPKPPASGGGFLSSLLSKEFTSVLYNLLGRKVGALTGIPGAPLVGGRIGNIIHRMVNQTEEAVGGAAGRGRAVAAIPAIVSDLPPGVDEQMVQTIMKAWKFPRAKAIEVAAASSVKPAVTRTPAPPAEPVPPPAPAPAPAPTHPAEAPAFTEDQIAQLLGDRYVPPPKPPSQFTPEETAAILASSRRNIAAQEGRPIPPAAPPSPPAVTENVPGVSGEAPAPAPAAPPKRTGLLSRLLRGSTEEPAPAPEAAPEGEVIDQGRRAFLRKAGAGVAGAAMPETVAKAVTGAAAPAASEAGAYWPAPSLLKKVLDIMSAVRGQHGDFESGIALKGTGGSMGGIGSTEDIARALEAEAELRGVSINDLHQIMTTVAPWSRGVESIASEADRPYVSEISKMVSDMYYANNARQAGVAAWRGIERAYRSTNPQVKEVARLLAEGKPNEAIPILEAIGGGEKAIKLPKSLQSHYYDLWGTAQQMAGNPNFVTERSNIEAWREAMSKAAAKDPLNISALRTKKAPSAPAGSAGESEAPVSAPAASSASPPAPPAPPAGVEGEAHNAIPKPPSVGRKAPAPPTVTEAPAAEGQPAAAAAEAPAASTPDKGLVGEALAKQKQPPKERVLTTKGKRQVLEGVKHETTIDMQPVESSAFSAAGYDEGSQTLALTHKNGDTYRYRGVSPQEYGEALNGPAGYDPEKTGVKWSVGRAMGALAKKYGDTASKEGTAEIPTPPPNKGLVGDALLKAKAQEPLAGAPEPPKLSGGWNLDHYRPVQGGNIKFTVRRVQGETKAEAFGTITADAVEMVGVTAHKGDGPAVAAALRDIAKATGKSRIVFTHANPSSEHAVRWRANMERLGEGKQLPDGTFELNLKGGKALDKQPALAPLKANPKLNLYEDMTPDQELQHVASGNKPAFLHDDDASVINDLEAQAKAAKLPYVKQWLDSKTAKGKYGIIYVGKDQAKLDALLKARGDAEATGRALGYSEENIKAYQAQTKPKDKGLIGNAISKPKPKTGPPYKVGDILADGRIVAEVDAKGNYTELRRPKGAGPKPPGKGYGD